MRLFFRCLFAFGLACTPISDSELTVEFDELDASMDPEVRVEVERSKVGSEESIFVEQSIWLVEGWTVEAGPLSASGMEIERLSISDSVVDGGRQLQMTRYALNAPSGRYIVVPGIYTFTGPTGESRNTQPSSIFVDIGETDPLSTALTEFEAVPVPVVEAEPSRRWWPLLLAFVGFVLLCFWFWRRKQTKEPTVHPMDRAIEDWVRARKSISDPQKLAYQLSWIFRGYLEAMDEWPAQKRTSPEVLIWLESEREPVLEGELLAAAERILRATDRLKFAGEGGGGRFFEQMEMDLRIVLIETRTQAESRTQDVEYD